MFRCSRRSRSSSVTQCMLLSTCSHFVLARSPQCYVSTYRLVAGVEVVMISICDSLRERRFTQTS